MNWKQIQEDNEELETIKGWKHYPLNYCKEEPPTIGEIRKNYQESENEGWKQSVHPYCKSCYGLYSQVCEEVSKAFNIPSHPTTIDRWKNEDLTKKINEIGNLAARKYSSFELLNILTPLIKSLIDCIKTRHYHYGKCYFNNDISNPSLIKADKLHMIQITRLCQNLLILYKYYKTAYDSFNTYTKMSDKEIQDFSITEEHVFNICRHQLVPKKKRKLLIK